MSEEDKKTDAKDGAGDKGTDGKHIEPEKKDNGKEEKGKENGGEEKKETIPKSRFDQVYKEKKEAEEKLEKMEKDKEDAEKAKLEEEGKYKELYEEEKKKTEEIDALKKNIEKKDEVLQGHLSTLLEKIPEEKLALIPDGTPDSQLNYISKNQKFLLGEEKPEGKRIAGTPPPNDRKRVEEIDEKKNKFEELAKKQKEEGYLNILEQKEFLKLSREIKEEEEEKQK